MKKSKMPKPKNTFQKTNYFIHKKVNLKQLTDSPIKLAGANSSGASKIKNWKNNKFWQHKDPFKQLTDSPIKRVGANSSGASRTSV